MHQEALVYWWGLLRKHWSIDRICPTRQISMWTNWMDGWMGKWLRERKEGNKEKGEEKRHFAHDSKKYNLKLSCRTLHNDYWGDISFYKIPFPSFVVCVHERARVCDFAISLSLSVPAMSFSCSLSLCILLSCFPGEHKAEVQQMRILR